MTPPGRRHDRSRVLCLLLLAAATVTAPAAAAERRVPAQWEPQEAIWMQWPGPWERSYETSFARMANVIVRYEKLHILHATERILESAREAIAREGGDPDHAGIHWHAVPNDSAWMRDNGPVWIVEDGVTRLQDWRFDAWGGAFGADIPYFHDDRVPLEVARIAGVQAETVDIVHERGNLEFNGAGTLILNWSVIGDPRRNGDYSRGEAEADLLKHFGLSRVVFVEGVPQGDLTNGHIDGFARFIDPQTVVVARCSGDAQCAGSTTGEVYDRAAQTIAAAGLTVIRDPVSTTVEHAGVRFDANYMNWLVGNGFVIVNGFGDAHADDDARRRIESYFPGRDVHVIEMLDSWAAGGGVHCHTNDQPAGPA